MDAKQIHWNIQTFYEEQKVVLKINIQILFYYLQLIVHFVNWQYLISVYFSTSAF